MHKPTTLSSEHDRSESGDVRAQVPELREDDDVHRPASLVQCVYDDGGLTYCSWCYTHDKPFPHD